MFGLKGIKRIKKLTNVVVAPIKLHPGVFFDA